MKNKHLIPESERDRILGPWHDWFFKHNFNTKDNIWALLEMVFTPEELETLDPDSIVIRSGSLTDASRLKEYVSDLIIGIKFTDGSETMLTVVFEHKSYTDPKLRTQVLNYMVRLFENNTKVVIPVVVYHGRRAWGSRTTFYAMQYADISSEILGVWGRKLLNFELFVLDLRDDGVQARLEKAQSSLDAVLSMQIMGQFWESEEREYLEWLHRAKQIDESLRKHFIQGLSVYLTSTKPEVTMQGLKELLEAIWPGDVEMREALELWEKYQPESAAEYFDIVHKKGRQEGVKEVAERLIGRGMTDTDIHVFTQLSLEEIAGLRNGSSG